MMIKNTTACEVIVCSSRESVPFGKIMTFRKKHWRPTYTFIRQPILTMNWGA